MNNIIQRMIRKSDDEVDKHCVFFHNGTQQDQDWSMSPENNNNKPGQWEKRQENSTPSKTTLMNFQKSKLSTLTENIKLRVTRSTTPKKSQKTSPSRQSSEMPVLEDIIKEFETNYLSQAKTSGKPKNFVRKIVAAFEEKYKTYENPMDNSENAPSTSSTVTPEKSAAEETSKKLPRFLTSKNVNFDCTKSMENIYYSSDDSINQKEVTSTIGTSKDRKDTAPRIVGAYLKKPVEVEETAIDWIPITGTRLPRKKSFKKLLSILTGRKKSESYKHQVIFSSQQNLTADEPRDIQDSGYEKSSSSSSSLQSITESLLHQENSYVESSKRSTFSTFVRDRTSTGSELDDKPKDTSYRKSCDSGKLVLDEVPRSKLADDLGPLYPGNPSKFTKSLGRRGLTCSKKMRLAAEDLSNLDTLKGSIVTLTKDDPEEVTDPGQDILTVEYRKKVKSALKSSEVVYDVPRRHCLWRSEPGISDALRSSKSEPIYDVPVPMAQRPRSNVYEESLSLQRRNVFFDSDLASGFYGDPGERSYATVKPRNRKINVSREIIRSCMDIESRCLERPAYRPSLMI